MRNSKSIVTALLFALVANVVSAADKIAIAYWDHDGTDINGDPEVLWNARYAIAPVGSDLNASELSIVSQLTVDLMINNDAEIALKISGRPQSVQDAITAAFRADDITAALSTLPKNRNYLLFVQVADASGNWSTWSLSQDLIDKTPPRGPSKINYR